MGKVMNKKIFAGLLFCVFCDFGAYADSCVKRDLKVTISCRGPEPAGTLPADTVAIYGQRLDVFPDIKYGQVPEICPTPSGYVYGGVGYYIDGQEVASYTVTGNPSNSLGVIHNYRYKSDMEIGPKWISKSKVAKEIDIKNRTDFSWISREYKNAIDGTWAKYYPYGKVSGISRCSKVAPRFVADGFATTQDLSYSGTGSYCWCKATAPASSAWVFHWNGYAYTSASQCASECAEDCVGKSPYWFFPTSPSGAIN